MLPTGDKEGDNGEVSTLLGKVHSTLFTVIWFVCSIRSKYTVAEVKTIWTVVWLSINFTLFSKSCDEIKLASGDK